MDSLLKNHPFAVSANFISSTILTFAVSKNELFPLVPAPLSLDLFEDKWAFLTIAMVDTKYLRPKGFPKFLGNNFFLIGYRIFVRYKTSEGKNLRGLFILKSETNRKRMELLGNVFTKYAYTTTDILCKSSRNYAEISSKRSKFNLSYKRIEDEPIPLPEGSVFPSWKEARRFAGPLPFTFNVDTKEHKVLIVEGVREDWKPQPIEVLFQSFDFLKQFHFKNIFLSNAFEIRNIPYAWKKGRIDRW